MTLPLLLGETPSKAEGPDAWKRPLSGRVALTLCVLAGLDLTIGRAPYDVLCEHFNCANAYPQHETPPPSNDDLLGWLQVRTRHEQLVARLRPHAVVILGRSASRAAGLDGTEPWGEWICDSPPAITVIPHPSGLNRLYNDDNYRALARDVLTKARCL